MNNTFYVAYLEDETTINNLPHECEYLIVHAPRIDISKQSNLNLPVLLKMIIILTTYKHIFKNIKEFWKLPFGCKIIGINRMRINGDCGYFMKFDKNVNVSPISLKNDVHGYCKYVKLEIVKDNTHGKKYFRYVTYG